MSTTNMFAPLLFHKCFVLATSSIVLFASNWNQKKKKKKKNS